MKNRDELYQLAEAAGTRLLRAGWRLALAESCTGGGIARAITDIPGSSQWFECGWVTYSNASKEQQLGVGAAALRVHGAVSAEVAEAMAAGALLAGGVQLALAVSGIAGPDGGSESKPVGLVWFGLASQGGAPRAVQKRYQGDRAAVRHQAVRDALGLIAAAVP